MFFQYFKGLANNRFYWMLFIVVFGISFKLPRITELSPYPLIVVLGIVWVSLPLVDPRGILCVNEFLIELPLIREKLALLSAYALMLPLLPLFLKFENTAMILLGIFSIILSSFLSFNSVFNLIFSPLAFAFLLISCQPLMLAALVALTGPYVLWVFGTIGKFISLRVNFQGFQINPKYAVLSSIVILLFEGLYNGGMEFVVDEYIGFRNPDFNPLVFLIFSFLSIAVISVPYFTPFGLREVDIHIEYIRTLLGTPLQRRVTAFTLALVLELPVVFFLTSLKHFIIPIENSLKIAITGAFFNSIVPTGRNSKWTGYSFMGYMVVVHIFLIRVPVWYVFGVFFPLSILFYDVDVWGYGR